MGEQLSSDFLLEDLLLISFTMLCTGVPALRSKTAHERHKSHASIRRPTDLTTPLSHSWIWWRYEMASAREERQCHQ